MSNATPEMAFNQKPNHITGMKRFIALSGTAGAAPRTRRASTPLMPATSPIPTVWQARIAGKAYTDGDSRIHVLKAVDSSHVRKEPMAHADSRRAGPKRRLKIW